LESAKLLVDRYISTVAPDAVTLARTLELPLAASLPGSPALRLRARNQGQALSQLAPRDALTRSLQRLVGRRKATASWREGALGWLSSLLGGRA